MLTIVCGIPCILSIALFSLLMAKNKVLIDFGLRVREYRKAKGLSQEELSFKADLHRTYIGMIERAEKNITLRNIAKIAKALDITISDLFS